MCFNQTGNISTLGGSSLKLVDKFTYLGSSVSSTEKDIDTRLTKAWTAIDRLAVIWKSDLTNKMKHSFFQAAIVSILLYGCTTWTLTKRMEKKLDGNYIRMLRAILKKSWTQHPTKQQLYGHLLPITKSIKVRWTRHCWRSRDELISDVLLWTPPHMAEQKQGDQLEPTYSSSVRTPDVALRTCQKRWTIGSSGERGSGISVLVARHDNDITMHIYDMGCDLEDLLEAMDDREGWWERVRDIHAGGTTWWWWWLLRLIDKKKTKQLLHCWLIMLLLVPRQGLKVFDHCFFFFLGNGKNR